MYKSGPADSNYSNLYTELLAMVFRALQSIPCQGKRHGVGSGGGGEQAGWIW